MVERYTHLSPTHRAAAVERIAGEFPNAIPKAAAVVATSPPVSAVK
jgi:hypothetical protein